MKIMRFSLLVVLLGSVLSFLAGCGLSPTPSVEQDDEAQDLIARAKADLANRRSVSRNEIKVEQVEKVEFPDASLGVPEPGEMYAQVVTPGYIIRLSLDNRVYEYHAADERAVYTPVEGKSSGDSITDQFGFDG